MLRDVSSDYLFFFLFFNVQVICPDNLLVLAVYPFFCVILKAFLFYLVICMLDPACCSVVFIIPDFK